MRGGADRMIGAEARVLDWADGAGHVQAAGERWRAHGEGAFEPGDRARIRELDGLTLEIEEARDAPPEPREKSP
ncbi:MAG: NfeD family protein [Alphaproteobacteria bacterium]